MAIIVALGWLEMAPAAGYDFRPMYQAGWSVLNGTPVYDVPMFGYPPFAALFFVPFALFDWTSATHAYAVIQLLAAIAGGAVLGAGLFRRHRLFGASAVTLAMMSSMFFWRSVHLYNVSLLMMTPLVIVALLWAGVTSAGDTRTSTAGAGFPRDAHSARQGSLWCTGTVGQQHHDFEGVSRPGDVSCGARPSGDPVQRAQRRQGRPDPVVRRSGRRHGRRIPCPCTTQFWLTRT